MLIYPIWVEIPATNLERAIKFYSAILDKELIVVDEGVRRYANLVKTNGNGAGASINQTENFLPSDKGVLIYFNTDAAMADILRKITDAGGEVVIPKSNISATSEDMGFYATFKDTEGNVLGIFSNR